MIQAFISCEKTEIKAHKLILSLSSPFFKDLFQDIHLVQKYKIIVPYCSEVICSFVRFFYFGEILIDTTFIPEFISLCREFNCEQQIPIVSELIQNYKSPMADEIAVSTNEVDVSQEWFDVKNTDLSITRVPLTKMEFDEYFETNESNEIFFNENENECIDGDSAMDDSGIKSGVKEIKEEYLNEEYIEENQQYEEQREAQKSKLPEIAEEKHEQESSQVERIHSKDAQGEPNPIFQANLHRVISRHVQKLNKQDEIRKKSIRDQQRSTTPSITFPALAMNLTQLREEQNRFKKRLQEAINSCRDSNNSIKKASKMFGVPSSAIERNLRGFKNLNPS